MVSLLGRIFKILVGLILVVALLAYAGVNVSAVITGLGIGGVAIEPEAELVDERLQLGDPLQRGVELVAQSLTFGASGRRGGLLIAHKPGG